MSKVLNRWIWTIILVVPACSSERGDGWPVQEWQAHERTRIGVVSGDPAQEFGRVMGVVKLRDGRIIVADHQALELKVFTGGGEYEQSLGGQGRGPGEFVGLTRLVRLPGDTVVAGNNLKMVTFSPEGSFVREQLMGWSGAVTPPLFVETQYPLNNGEFLLYALTSSSGQKEERELFRSSTMYLVAERETGVKDTLGSFGGLEQMTYQDVEGSHTAIPLFPASTMLMIGTNHLVVGDQAADSVLRYDLETKELTWIRLPLKAQAIPEAVRREASASSCDWTSDEDRRVRCEASLRMLPEQRRFPMFEDLAVDSLGRVWVKEYPQTASRENAVWIVIQSEGQATATVQLPENVRPMQIGRDYILGLVRDELGVQSVREYEVVRRGAHTTYN